MSPTGDEKEEDKNKDEPSQTDPPPRIAHANKKFIYDETDDDDLDYTQSNISNIELSISNRRWHSLESQESQGDNYVVVEKKQEQWANWCEFFWTASSSTVGLGNIWRFPMIAARHGGGAFLIPYLILTVFIGYPMVNLEFSLGQFMSHGPLRVWEMAPICRGVGIIVILVNIFTASFYNVIIGWCLNYFVYSFYTHFPWNHTKTDQTFDVAAKEFFLHKHLGLPNKSHEKLEFANGLGLNGPPQWNLVLGMIGGWVLIWLLLVGGLKVSGKLSYFLGLFPIVQLIFLLGATASLEGSASGVAQFWKANWRDLGNLNTWFEAAAQCFFSLNVGFGEMMIIASYKEFGQGCNTETLLVIVVDTLVSLLAGMSLFALMGNIAHITGRTTKEVLKNAVEDNGTFGIAFIMFPQATLSFGQYPGPQFFATTFFLMLVIVSVGSGTGFLNVVVGGICDYFPKVNKLIMTTVMCVLLCLSGIVYCCPSGLQLFELVGDFGSSYLAFVVVLLQAASVTWIYGLKNFTNDLEFMINTRVSRIKLFCWSFLCPFVMLGLCIGLLVKYKRRKYWPMIAEVSGWALFGSSLICVPIMAIVVIFTRKSKSFIKKIRASFRPTPVWGPKDPVIYKAWRKFKKQRPSEFKTTTLILHCCGLRKTVNSHQVESLQSTAKSSAASVKASESKTTKKNATLRLTPKPKQHKRTRKHREKTKGISATATAAPAASDTAAV